MKVLNYSLTHHFLLFFRSRNYESIVLITVPKKDNNNNINNNNNNNNNNTPDRRTKKYESKDKRNDSTTKNKFNSSNGTTTTSTDNNEATSPTIWKKVKMDFKESKSGNNKFNNNNNNNNNNKTKNNKNEKKNSHYQQQQDDDLWDLPTGLSQEESKGLNEREMFELERKKFLALRNQSTSGVSKENTYHSESDQVLDSMINEQNEGMKKSAIDVSCEGGIRSLTASEVMQSNDVTSEDMNWFGSMLNGSKSGNSNNNNEDDFFKKFLSDPVMPDSQTPSTKEYSHDQVSANSLSDDIGSTKTSRLGSILGIPLTPSTPEKSEQPPVPISEIKELSLESVNMSSGILTFNEPPANETKSKSFSSGTMEQPTGSNQKSRDLLATLGFSPPRNQPRTQPHHPNSIPFSPSHVMNGKNNNIDIGNHNSQFVFQQNDPQSNPPLPSPPVLTGNTPGKSSSDVETPSQSPAPCSGSKGPASSGKKTKMSASSRLHLARMKQGATKKRIEVSSLFNNAPPSSSTPATITTSETAPVPIPQSKGTPDNQSVTPKVVSSYSTAVKKAPHTSSMSSNVCEPNVKTTSTKNSNASPKVFTNTKGASLLMKLKK